MRFLCEIFIIGALLYLGWEKPYKQWIDEVRGNAAVARTPVQRQPVPTKSSGAWMYDPNRRSVLDTPGPRTLTSQPQPSGSAGSWLFDPSHHSTLDPPKHGSP